MPEIQWPAGDRGARVLGASAQRNGPLRTLLVRALAALYRAGVSVRNRAYDAGVLRAQRAAVPVISVGNIVAGGAGKTPFTRWLAGTITERGKRVAILHGGYGSDEPALHRQWHDAGLVIEQRDRVRAVQQAIAAGVDVVVLDDAFQHRRLARDLDIVLIPAETHAAHLLPAGPLREPERVLQRADLIIVTRKSASRADAARRAHQLHDRFQKPCAIAALEPAGIRPAQGGNAGLPARFVVVTAIARPDLLLEQLAGMGLDVERTYAYPDHYDFSAHDARQLLHSAEGTPMLITEKDAIKLVPLMPQADLWILEQRVTIEQGAEALNTMLNRVL